MEQTRDGSLLSRLLVSSDLRKYSCERGRGGEIHVMIYGYSLDYKDQNEDEAALAHPSECEDVADGLGDVQRSLGPCDRHV